MSKNQLRLYSHQDLLPELQANVNDVSGYEFHRSRTATIDQIQAYEPAFADLRTTWTVATQRIDAGSVKPDSDFELLRSYVESIRETVPELLAEWVVTSKLATETESDIQHMDGLLK